MSLYSSQLLPPPSGMATATDISSLKESQVQEMVGFLPQRFGKMRMAAIPKLLKSFSGGVQGLAVWMGSDGQWDTLLILSASSIYTVPLDYKTLGTIPAYQYDQIARGQRSALVVGTPGAVGGGSVVVGSTFNFAVQFQTELIFAVDNILYRYYRDEPSGTEHLHQLTTGDNPGAPTLAQTTGGSLTLLGAYSYLLTYEDEFGRETSPSGTTAITLTGSNNKVNVSRSTTPSSAISTWNVYRLNPGSTEYLLVANVAIGTVTYADVASDASIASNDAAPTSGENDFPASASIGTLWRDRLVLNNVNSPAFIQLSNAGSPTQFSTLPLPTNVADGFRAWVGGKGDNEITGFAELGGMLAVFKRSSMTFLQGDTIENFSLLPIHERGCSNPNSIQRCENVIIFASNDGIYSVLYENGYVLRKLSLEIDDILSGFTDVVEAETPTSFGQPMSWEVLTAIEPYMSSFYSRNRYYLSFGNRTLVFDVVGKGWADTGWGFVNFACVYKSQQAGRSLFLSFAGGIGAPETVFLCRGDIHSNTATANLIQKIEYFTACDTTFDPDFPAQPAGYVYASLKGRFYDGDGPPQNRRKRAKRFIRWGDTSAKPGQRIGTLKGYVGTELRCVFPIHAWVRIEKQDSLFEQDMSQIMTGELIYFVEEYTYPDLVLGNSMLEYSFLS